MAELRLIAALALAGVGCAQAGAEPVPASGVIAPAGWQALPDVAAAARGALGAGPNRGAAIEGVEAWGEPAMGCYAVWMALRGPGTASAIAEQVLGGLTPPPKPAERARGDLASPQVRAIDLSDVVKPTSATGVLAFTFLAPPYRGRLRAHLGGGRVTALACFANPREPIACEAACTGVLGSLP